MLVDTYNQESNISLESSKRKDGRDNLDIQGLCKVIY